MNENEVCFNGVSICRGIAIGKPFFFTLVEDKVPEFTIPKKDIDKEITRYKKAVSSSRKDVKLLQKKLKNENIDEGAAILDAHIQIMQDPLLTIQIEEEICASRKNAEYVLQSIIEKFQKKFLNLGDPFFRDRFNDIEDIYRRIMGYLRKSVRVSLADIPENSIVFSYKLNATDTAEANVAYVNAFVTTCGGTTSHAAIVANAKGIPYVTNINFDHMIESKKNGVVIVDGRCGDVLFNPDDITIKKYKKLQEKLALQVDMLTKTNSYPPETIDGHSITLSANIDMVEDVDTLSNWGAQGIGLFRSEYIFINNSTFPSEDEQYEIYKKIVEKMSGMPTVIRTFDFGGDKFSMKEEIPLDVNPFLGCRSIRYLLKERDIFKAQIRAILRAGELGEVKIMFPMISSLVEFLEAKEIVMEAKDELKQKGFNIDDNVQVGCRIEVPSAAITADLLAKACDFLSIGTNDLVQYSLAVDRQSHSQCGLFAPTDPSILRLINLVVCEANNYRKPLNVCGEMAADPRFIPLLLGLGVNELSVAPRFIPVIKRAIRNTSIVEAKHLAMRALNMISAKDIFNLLSEEYQKSFPDDELYNF